MYRKPGSQSVLSGALSGPYTGGKRLLDGALLDASVRERLNLATAGRGSPTPIAYARPESKETRRAAWGLILATMLLTWLFAVGFGDLYSRWAMPPSWMAAPYIALCLLFSLCLIPLLRRRALYGGGGALRPGRYLFPLDAVEVRLPDGSGAQLIEVRPLGDARDARIEGEGKNLELVIAFEGGERLRFPLRGDPSGEIALRRLEHAQHLIEEVTYTKALEPAFNNDIFFDLRVDGSWERFAPSGPAPAPTPLSLMLGRFARPIFVLAGVALGAFAFYTRRELGDVALYNQAEERGTVPALDLYLARGRRRQLAAQDHKQRLLDAAEAQRRREAADRAAANAPRVSEEERCLKALTERTSTAHPETVAYIARGIRGTHLPGHKRIWLEFEDDLGPDVAALDLDLREAELSFAHALEFVFSEICASTVLSVHHGHRRTGEQGIVVHNRVTVGGTPWKLDDAGTAARRVTFAFRVDFVGVDDKRLDGFVLTLDPPAAAPSKTRERSLYDLSRHQTGSPSLAYAALTARAYDRLYDEVWTLLFDGDPHVVWGRADP